MTAFADYAWWQVSPAQLKSMGFSGVMRYISHDGSKDITASEIANLRAAGFDIGVVFESTGNRSSQGFGAGHDDAVFANQRLDALGYPPHGLVTYAVDFDAAPAQVQPYFDGVASVGLRPSAPYGGIRVVDGVRYPAPLAWQTAAWSGGHVSPKAGLLQNGFNNTYDSNRVLVADFGQWRAGTVQEDDVALPDIPSGPNGDNAFIEIYNRLKNLELAVIGGGPSAEVNEFGSLAAQVTAVKAELDQLQAGGGQVDVAALAKAVADELERRLAG